MTTPTNSKKPFLNSSAHGLSKLTVRMARARTSQHEGESLLSIASIFAYTVCSALALTVAGGTWMFYNRAYHPTGLIAEVLKEDPSFDKVVYFYFALAILACALIIPSVVSLASKAAVLGAKGREKRLAVLRLLGLTSGEVTRMTMLESVVSSVIGCVIGTVIYLSTLGLWSGLTIMAQKISPKEMLLPWWGFLAVVGFIILLGVLSSWWGMQQVRVSPLGVARRTNSPALKAWRAVFFVIILVVCFLAVRNINLGGGASKNVLFTFLLFSAVLLLVIFGFNIVGPFCLQLAAKLIAKLPFASVKLASRRIIATPKATWRLVSGMGLLAFIAGYISMMPITLNTELTDGSAIKTFIDLSLWDFNKGAMITLVVGFLLTSASTLISQASQTIELAPQSRSLARMGATRSFELKAMWLETLGPLSFAVISGAVLGILFAMPMQAAAQQMSGKSVDTAVGPMLLLIGLGLGVTALALLACHPLQASLLKQQVRAND